MATTNDTVGLIREMRDATAKPMGDVHLEPFVSPLTMEQIGVLLRPIAKHRVKKLDGMSHVEAYDIRATLNRVFGFCGWSLEETTPPVCVVERPHKLNNGKDGVKVAYRAHVTITIHTDPPAKYAGSSVADATMPDYLIADAHDMALKSAESGALKRAATNLGDQFGLSLYNGGSVDPLVVRVVGFNTQEGQPGWGA